MKLNTIQYCKELFNEKPDDPEELKRLYAQLLLNFTLNSLKVLEIYDLEQGESL